MDEPKKKERPVLFLNEKTNISVLLLTIIIGALWAVYSALATKEYVNNRVDPVKESLAHITDRVDDIYNKLYENKGKH